MKVKKKRSRGGIGEERERGRGRSKEGSLELKCTKANTKECLGGVKSIENKKWR